MSSLSHTLFTKKRKHVGSRGPATWGALSPLSPCPRELWSSIPVCAAPVESQKQQTLFSRLACDSGHKEIKIEN